ncbi:MAG: hypothetical protein ABEN55_06820 [Bradymonadaceae bacterium]
MSQRAVEYTKLRLEGYGAREAGRKVGYCEGKAPKEARKTVEKAKELSPDDPGVRRQELEQDIAMLEFKLERKRRELRALQAMRDV